MFGMLNCLEGKYTVSDFFLILFWVCMPCGIGSVPLMLLCTSILLHVVPRMLYCLDNSELLFLSLAGITVCGFNRVI